MTRRHRRRRVCLLPGWAGGSVPLLAVIATVAIVVLALR